MTVYVDHESLDGACGVKHVFRFSNTCYYNYTDTLKSVTPGGIGLISAGFVNTPICKETYEILSEKYNVVYQSPVRRNRNSGHMFFFAIFEDKEVK